MHVIQVVVVAAAASDAAVSVATLAEGLCGRQPRKLEMYRFKNNGNFEIHK